MSKSNKMLLFLLVVHTKVSIVLVSVTSTLVDDLRHIQHSNQQKVSCLVCVSESREATKKLCVWACLDRYHYTLCLALVSCMMQCVQRSVRFQLNHCIMTVCVCLKVL